MRNTNTNAIVSKFNELDFYDDKLLSVQCKCSSLPRELVEIVFLFADDGTGKVKTLTFQDCANIKFSMDFDVLADNWFAQTDRLSASADPVLMKKIVRSQMKFWRINYMPPTSKTKPIDKKLSKIRKYALFKIAFKGGAVELLAKNCRLSYRR